MDEDDRKLLAQIKSERKNCNWYFGRPKPETLRSAMTADGRAAMDTKRAREIENRRATKVAREH